MKIAIVWKDKPDTIMEFESHEELLKFLKENKDVSGWMILEPGK